MSIHFWTQCSRMYAGRYANNVVCSQCTSKFRFCLVTRFFPHLSIFAIIVKHIEKEVDANNYNKINHTEAYIYIPFTTLWTLVLQWIIIKPIKSNNMVTSLFDGSSNIQHTCSEHIILLSALYLSLSFEHTHTRHIRTHIHFHHGHYRDSHIFILIKPNIING